MRMRPVVLATLLFAAIVAADQLRAQSPPLALAWHRRPWPRTAPVPKDAVGASRPQGTWDYKTITPPSVPRSSASASTSPLGSEAAGGGAAGKRMTNRRRRNSPNQSGDDSHATYLTDPGGAWTTIGARR